MWAMKFYICVLYSIVFHLAQPLRKIGAGNLLHHQTFKIAAAPCLNKFGRHKRIHLVRHAQGIHNLEPTKTRDPLTSFQYFDAPLSSLGCQQVIDQRKYVSEHGLLDQIEVVIASPMTRTLQTAMGIFGGEEQLDRLEVTSCEDSNVKMDETFNTRPPIVAYELCRERMGQHECDKRGSISQYRSRFPAVDFSLIENENDVLWNPNQVETNEALKARAIKFIKWLWERKEQEIAVVSHGIFLQQAMIELFGKNKCYPGDPCSRFKNCEMRSVVILHESIMGLGSDSTMRNQYYCGMIGNEMLRIRDSAIDRVQVEELEVTV